MKLLRLQNSLLLSLLSAFVMVAVAGLLFDLMEPAVTNAAGKVSKGVIVNQTISSEISFKTATTTITMQPAGGINGLTGGSSSGTTTAIVTTNNSAGYYMTVQFSSTTAMARNGGSGYINNYHPTTAGVPDYGFNPQNYGQFGFTVYSATAGGDVVQRFLSTAGSCNAAGGSSVAGHCWLNPTTTPLTVVNRTSPTPASGATTSIAYHVEVPSNPNPAIPNGSYTATTTLTATTN